MYMYVCMNMLCKVLNQPVSQRLLYEFLALNDEYIRNMYIILPFPLACMKKNCNGSR